MDFGQRPRSCSNLTKEQKKARMREMLDYLISISTAKDRIKVETDPERLRPIDADLQVPNTKKFEQHTGWKPEITFKQTMQDLLDYWRNRVKNGENFLTR